MATIKHAILKTNPHIQEVVTNSQGTTVTIEFPPGHTDFSGFFTAEVDLETVDMSDLCFKPDSEINMAYMFTHCTRLKDVVFFTTEDSVSEIRLGSTFYQCKALTTIDMLSIKTEHLLFNSNTFNTGHDKFTMITLPQAADVLRYGGDRPYPFQFIRKGTVVISNQERMVGFNQLFSNDYDGHITINMSETFFDTLNHEDYKHMSDAHYTFVIT